MTLTINGLEAASMRWLAPWSGVWSADVEVHGEIAPTGRVVIASLSGIVLVGTVDPARSGTFGEKRHVRVIGGGGGWGKNVRAQHYHSDVGLPLSVVALSTGAEAGEVATVLAPTVLGTDFVRRAGPASQIFTDAGVDWWVGLDGVTRAGIRLPAIPPLSLEILDWDPAAGTMKFTADVLVEPGTVLVDLRFGRRIVREVEAVVSGGSVTGTLWVAEEPPSVGTVVDELVDGLGALAREATRAEFGRFYEYRVITMAGERVMLQAVTRSNGMPDILPASVCAGISGYKAKLRPASKCLVGFVAGDPKRPYVAFYEAPEGDGWRPLEIELDAATSVAIGALALSITLGLPGPTAKPVLRMTESFAAWITAVTAAVNTVAPGSAVPPTDIASLKVVSS